jgi:hypothetical protein
MPIQVYVEAITGYAPVETPADYPATRSRARRFSS